jgi:hypothetical protein
MGDHYVDREDVQYIHKYRMWLRPSYWSPCVGRPHKQQVQVFSASAWSKVRIQLLPRDDGYIRWKRA